jgi:hypothetical protein
VELTGPESAVYLYLEVAEHDGDLGAGDGQDDEHQQQEAEHVVVLVHPDAVQAGQGTGKG